MCSPEEYKPILKEALENRYVIKMINMYIELKDLIYVSPNIEKRGCCSIGEVYSYSNDRLAIKLDSELWLVYFTNNDVKVQSNKPWWVNCNDFNTY